MSGEIALFGISTKVIGAGVVGGMIGAFLVRGTPLQRVGTGLAGFGAAIFLHPPVAKIIGWLMSLVVSREWMPAEIDLHVSAGFMLGLIGLIAAQALVTGAEAVRDRVDDVIEDRLGTDREGTNAGPKSN